MSRRPGIENKTWYVYLMECDLEDVGDYVGITTRPFARENEHKRKKRGYKLAAAIALYGAEHFSYKIIATCSNEVDARMQEARFIKALGTAWPQGLNVSGAGPGIYSTESYEENYGNRRRAQIALWDDEARRERHAARLKQVSEREEVRAKNKAAAARRWADPVYRARQALKWGRPHSEEAKEKIRQKKLAASAAKGGPKPRSKYPGLTGRERLAAIAAANPDRERKIRETWEKNREKNVARIRAANAIHNSDPEIIAKRSAGRSLTAKRHPVTMSTEARRKMSVSQAIRWKRIREQKALLEKPSGNA